MTAKEVLDMFRARAQFQITLAAFGIYFIVVLIFLLVMHRIASDQRLTIAVLLLTPLPGLMGLAGAFWLQRARDDSQQEKLPTVTTTAGPDGTSTSITPTPGAPVPDPPKDLPAVP